MRNLKLDRQLKFKGLPCMAEICAMLAAKDVRPRRKTSLTLLTAIGVLLSAQPTFAAGVWTGTTSTDWNTAGNWDTGVVPSAINATINTIPANICTITASPSAKPVDVIVGSAATGRVDHRAGSLIQNVVGSAGNWVFIGSSAGTGTYNLANTAVTGQANLTTFGQGSGSMTVGKLWVGGRDTSAGTGTFNMNSTGSILAQSTSINTASVIVGSFGGTGTLNLDSGTITSSGDLWIANEGAAAVSTTGTVNLSGGTINAATIWMCTNNSTATAVANLNITNATVNASGRTLVTYGTSNTRLMKGTINVGNGGILNSESDLQIAFAGAGTSTGAVNIATGGTVNVGTTATRWLIMNVYDPIAANLTVDGGTLNLNANTAIQFDTGGNSSGAAVLTLNSGAINMWSGNQTGAAVPGTTSGIMNLNNGNSSSANSTVNLNGGTLTIGGIIAGYTVGTRVFNFNGGKLKATAANGSFFASGVASAANVRNNTSTIDNNGNAITIGQALQHSAISGDNATDGGLIFADSGAAATTTLTGANTFNGNLTVNSGTVAVSGPALGDPGSAASQSSGLGNIGTGVARSLIINNGGTLSLTGGNLLGTGSSVNTLSGLTLTVNAGGVFKTGANSAGAGWWNKVGAVNLNGGIISVGSGATSQYYQGMALIGTVTVGGSTASTINNLASSDSSYNAIHLGQNSTAGQAITFNVADVTGDANPDLTIAAKMVDTAANLVSSGLTKTGVGTLVLSAANGYTGPTVVNGGTLLVNGSLAAGSAVSVSGSGSVLGGSGTIGGGATLSSGAALTPRTSGGSATTLTFNGNVTLQTGASANLTLGATASGSNDKVNYGTTSTLTLDSSDTINITASGGLDTLTPYPLFASSGGTVTMATTPTLKINGVTSDQSTPGSYKLAIVGSTLVLQYIPLSTPPSVNSASASVTSLVHNQSTTITVNITPASGQSITSVNVMVDGLAGGSDPTALNGPGGDGTGNWTGTFTVPAGKSFSTYSISGTVLQSDATTTPWAVNGITVSASSPVWNGGGGDANWSTANNWGGGTPVNVAPGTSGDSVTFTGNTQTSPNMDQSYSVTGLTLGSGATADFSVGGSSVLTVGASGVVNNSTTANQLTLNTPLALSAATTVNAASGGITLGSTVANGGNLLTVTGTKNTVINGVISGSGGLSKMGAGSETLSGLNTYTGATTVSAGALALSGSINNASQITAANVAGSAKIVVNSGGTLASTKSSAPAIAAGTLAGANGTIILNSGGTLSSSSELWLSQVAGGYGSLTINGGTAAVGSWFCLSRGGGIGILNLNSGSINVSGANLTIGTINGSDNYAVATLAGGSVNVSSTAVSSGGIYVGEITHGELNISGAAQVTAAGPVGVTFANTATTSSGILNLNGGILTAQVVKRGNNTATYGILNFNGGTLRSSASGTFLSGLTAANVFAGNGTIDNNGNGITVSQVLAAPGGYGVNSIAVGAAGSGYLDTPVVKLAGGSGTGATAIAQIDYNAGTVTGIVVTAHGTGYAASDTLTATISGGGGTGATAGTITLASNISGGMTFQGSGTTTLTGGNTYSGNTTISSGTLALNGSGYLSSPNTSVSVGAKFDVSALSSYTLNSGALTLNIDKTSGTRTQGQVVIADKNLTYAGTLTVSKSGSDALVNGDSFTLFSRTTGNVNGWFSAVDMPALSSGLAWDTNKLAATGVVDIYSFTASALAFSTPKETTATIAAAKLNNHLASARNTSAYPAGAGWSATVATNPGHGTASMDGSGNLIYTPAAGYTGSDSFMVKFADGHGSQLMTVNATVGYDNGGSPNIVNGPTISAGSFTVTFAGIPGYTYTVETNSMVGPGWVKEGNYTAPASGIFEVLDPIGNTPSLYYRTVYPSY